MGDTTEETPPDAVDSAAADVADGVGDYDELTAAVEQASAAVQEAAGDADDGSDAPDSIDPAAVDALLRAATFDDAEGASFDGEDDAPSSGPAAAGADRLDLPDFQRVVGDVQASSIDLLRDVDLNVAIELGRSRMLVEDVLRLAEGSVVELDKLAGDPVDVFINDRLVARGEVLVLNDNFCVRVNEIVPVTPVEAA